jgi:hypothetical protein
LTIARLELGALPCGIGGYIGAWVRKPTQALPQPMTEASLPVLSVSVISLPSFGGTAIGSGTRGSVAVAGSRPIHRETLNAPAVPLLSAGFAAGALFGAAAVAGYLAMSEPAPPVSSEAILLPKRDRMPPLPAHWV